MSWLSGWRGHGCDGVESVEGVERERSPGAWSARCTEDHASYKELPKYVVSGTLPEDALVEGWVR